MIDITTPDAVIDRLMLMVKADPDIQQRRQKLVEQQKRKYGDKLRTNLNFNGNKVERVER